MPNIRYRPLFLAAVFVVAAAGCRPSSTPEPPAAPAETQPVPTAANADDVQDFDAYIAGKPTPEQFRARYPGVTLVLPGDIATREFRSDRSRYFAELDEQQRISGGKFQ